MQGGSSRDGEDKASSASNPFEFDAEAYAKFKEEKPWTRNKKFIKRCRVSAIAAMKMVNHAVEGVERGMAGPNRMPIEIMGLIVGRSDYTSRGDLLVTDAFPLPMHGSEVEVVVTEEVGSYITKIADSLRKTRKEHIVGWYHSHPFDVGVHSNCYFSHIDCNSQYLWQNLEDGMGTPWTGIVVDPLRSLAKNTPNLAAFRCYPPSHTPPPLEGPDGVRYPDEASVIERWGTAYKSYYDIPVEYFQSATGEAMMDTVNRDFLWTRVLATSSSLHKETRDSIATRIRSIADGVKDVTGTSMLGRGGGSGSKGGIKASSSVAVEQLLGARSEAVKEIVFNTPQGQVRDATDASDKDEPMG